MKVVALADSDSYLKWAGSFLASLPADWERELLLVDSTVAPSATQRAAALVTSGIAPDSVVPVPLPELGERLRDCAADVVLVATRGPVARVLLRMIAAGSGADRPVLVSGLPGISIPATRKALRFRQQADLFVVHSRRELVEFTTLSSANGWHQRFALGTLPFAHRDAVSGGSDLLFAAQAIVPRERSDRMRIARLLVDAAVAEPARRVVVKLRAVEGEHQTHAEQDGYLGLLEELRAERRHLPSNLVISTEPMSSALRRAEGLLTVSSTAAIEAVARGVPVIALDTFGVSDELINPVFVGSGLFGGESAVIAREFRHPDRRWLDANYFHDPADDDCVAQLATLVGLARTGELPWRAADRGVGGRLRLAWDRRRAFGRVDRSWSGVAALVVGIPARAVVVVGRRMRRSVRPRTQLVE